MAAATGARKKRRLERVMPVGYSFLALVFVVFALPTVLRPPQEPPNETAELSPDAPPDNEEPLIEALNRGQTGTAGSGEGVGEAGGDAPGGEVGGAGPPVEPPKTGKPRSCPFGFGNPPRQTDSVYSPPCAEAFTGDNGGATYRGVSRNEIRVATPSGTGNNSCNRVGFVTPAAPGDNATCKTLSVWEQYFNQAFQLYGRRIRIWHQNSDGLNEANARADADELAASSVDVFGTGMYPEAACDQFSRYGIVAYCPQLALGYFTNPRRAGKIWSYFMDGTSLADFQAEYACKKLIGKPASFGGPTVANTTRKLGVIAIDLPNTREPAQDFVRLFKERCGGEATLVLYSVGEDARYGTAMKTLQLDGVTTVLPYNDFLTLIPLLQQADGSGYYPEWFISGFGAHDRNQIGQLFSQTQWVHAFGVSSLDMERPFKSQDCFRAYRQIDQTATPAKALCIAVWQSLFQLVSGIQEAGPVLTQETFMKGQFKRGYRFGNPGWALGGGYSAGDYTYSDDVAEVWWDPAAPDPSDAQNRPGAYRYVRQGQRYKKGTLPTENPLVFDDGVTTRDDF